MQHNLTEQRWLDDSIDRLLAIRPAKTEAEELVEKCTALRLGVGGVLSAELRQLVGAESVPLQTIINGHWSATIVWASHADPATLTDSDIEEVRLCYLQVSTCFSRMTWQLAVTFDALETRWHDSIPKRNWNVTDDIYFASRFYDVLAKSEGEESCNNDFGDEMIAYRINDARTLFAQIAIRDLLIRGFPIRAWEHFLKPLFARLFDFQRARWL